MNWTPRTDRRLWSAWCVRDGIPGGKERKHGKTLRKLRRGPCGRIEVLRELRREGPRRKTGGANRAVLFFLRERAPSRSRVLSVLRRETQSPDGKTRSVVLRYSPVGDKPDAAGGPGKNVPNEDGKSIFHNLSRENEKKYDSTGRWLCNVGIVDVPNFKRFID